MSEFHRQVPGLANLIRSAPITINSVMATGKRMNKLYSTGTVHLHGKLKTLSVGSPPTSAGALPPEFIYPSRVHIWVSPYLSYLGCFSALRLHVSIVQLASAVNVLVCYE